MKQSFKRLLVIQTVLFAFAITSCSSPKNSNKYQIPWRGDDGNYSLQTVTIGSLSDPDSLSSPLVKLFVTPSEDGGRLSAPPAIGRFMTRKDGVKIPLDFVSLQGATIHAHFERIHEFDKAAGAESLIGWPIDISVETEVTSGGDNTNNAFFDGSRNAILILPYTDQSRKGLPISLNGGVLAHEHFHALFFELVLKKLLRTGLDIDTGIPEISIEMPKISRLEDNKLGTEEMRRSMRDFNAFLLRGLNEGLADFWSWLAVGDEQFVGRSISQYGECRRLDKKFTSLPVSSDLHNRVFGANVLPEEEQQFRGWMAYQVGAQYARFFRELATSTYGEKLSYTDRIEMAQAIIKGLGGNFAAEAVQEYATQEISVEKIVDSVLQNLTDDRFNEKSCSVIAEFKPFGTKLPEACAKFNLNSDQVIAAKHARMKNAPQLQYCKCETVTIQGYEVSTCQK